MGTIFRRGDRWFLSFKDATGKWRQASAETTDEGVAQKTLKDVEAGVAAQRDAGASGPLTLKQYVDRWIEKRRKIFESDGKQFRSWKDDRGWLYNHVLPKLGHLQLDEIRPRLLARFFFELRTNSTRKLAPHSIRNIYGVLCSVFRDAAVDELVAHSPCILSDAELGEDKLVDPVAQAEDRYSREDLQAMIWSDAITADERVFVAIGGFTGLRLGGIAGLCWRDYCAAEPLWRLTSQFAYDGLPTKTDRPSAVPVHPTLKTILDEWKATGWPAMFGREPTPDDPIVPRPPRKGARAGVGTAHSEKTGGDLIDRVLETLGIEKPAKKTHAVRSTHVTLIEEDGANTFYVSKWTHPGKRKKDAFDVYRKGNWEAMCREMIKLQLLKPFGGDEKAEQSSDENGGGGGSRTPISTQSLLSQTPHLGGLDIAASAQSATAESGAPKTFWRQSIGFVTPTAATEKTDVITTDMEAALAAHRAGDRRAARRALLRALAALDE